MLVSVETQSWQDGFSAVAKICVHSLQVKLSQPVSRANGRPAYPAQPSAASMQDQALLRLGVRCLMGAMLGACATSAAASSAAERGEWQPRRHHRRLEREEMREYTQVAVADMHALPRDAKLQARTTLMRAPCLDLTASFVPLS